MQIKDLLATFRQESDDLFEPYLWSDAEFLVYLNDAQDKFVRNTGGLADRRSPLTKISFNAGDKFKKYDERILHIKGATTNNNRVLSIQNLDNFQSTNDDYGRSFNTGVDDAVTGEVRVLITDISASEIQLYPIPDAAGYVQLFVYRRPLNNIDSLDSVLEIPSFQHLCLLYWVQYKAFMKNDVETFDQAKAAEYRAAFTDAVAEAKKEKSSREDRKRLMRYGGL